MSYPIVHNASQGLAYSLFVNREGEWVFEAEAGRDDGNRGKAGEHGTVDQHLAHSSADRKLS